MTTIVIIEFRGSGTNYTLVGDVMELIYLKSYKRLNKESLKTLSY